MRETHVFDPLVRTPSRQRHTNTHVFRTTGFRIPSIILMPRKSKNIKGTGFDAKLQICRHFYSYVFPQKRHHLIRLQSWITYANRKPKNNGSSRRQRKIIPILTIVLGLKLTNKEPGSNSNYDSAKNLRLLYNPFQLKIVRASLSCVHANLNRRSTLVRLIANTTSGWKKLRAVEGYH